MDDSLPVSYLHHFRPLNSCRVFSWFDKINASDWWQRYINWNRLQGPLRWLLESKTVNIIGCSWKFLRWGDIKLIVCGSVHFFFRSFRTAVATELVYSKFDPSLKITFRRQVEGMIPFHIKGRQLDSRLLSSRKISYFFLRASRML